MQAAQERDQLLQQERLDRIFQEEQARKQKEQERLARE